MAATIRQKKAFKEVLKGSSISSAMRKVGYSKTTASTTGKLTNTQGWQELLDKHLPDDMLSQRHRELLDKRDTISMKVGKKWITIDKGPETNAVKSALDMGYKLKGHYAPEKKDIRKIIVHINPESKKKAGGAIGSFLNGA